MYSGMYTGVVGAAAHSGMSVFLRTPGYCEVNLEVVERILWYCCILCIVFRVFKL